MARKAVSEAEPVQDLADVPLPSPEVVTEPTPEAEPEPVQEPEKPDPRELLTSLAPEERSALLEEVFGEELRRRDQSAQDKAQARIRADQARQYQANAGLQQVLQSLDVETDDTKRAQAVYAYADQYARGTAYQWSQDTMEQIRQAYGVKPEEHDEIVLRLHQKAAREGRVATFGDYIQQVTGEKFMPKTEVSKALREEIKAQLAEAQGQRIKGQAEEAPVSMGPGGGSSTADVATAVGQEAKKEAFEKKYGFKPL